MSCSPFALVSVLVESSVLASLSASADEDCDVLVPVMSSSALLAADCMAKVMTMANTDSTAATMDRGFATLFSERAHDSHDRQYRADESEDRRDIVDDWNEAQHQAERAEHHAHDATYRRALRSRGRHDRRGSHTVRRCRAAVGNRSIVELTHDLFFLLEVVGTLSSLRDRLRSRYWTKVHSCLHFVARGLRHHAR